MYIIQLHKSIKCRDPLLPSMKTFLVILTKRRHLVPFVNLNILFVLMLFSGKFAIEMYAVGIINRIQDTMDENIATIFLGKLICFAFYKYFTFVSCLRSCQFHWLGYLSHYSEVFEEKMDIDVFSICDGNCSHYSRSVTHKEQASQQMEHFRILPIESGRHYKILGILDLPLNLHVLCSNWTMLNTVHVHCGNVST